MRPVRILLAFVLACIVTTQATAQLTDERHTLTVGITGGLNLSKASFSPSIKQNSQNVPSAGIVIRYVSEKYFKMLCGLQAEVNYSQRGWNELIEDGSNDTYNRVTKYVEVPLLAHLAFGKDSQKRGVQFFLNLGPQFSYFIGETENQSAEWHPEYRPGGVNAQYGLPTENKFDYGIVVGMGLDFATGIGHFVLDGRYYYGLADFFGNTKKDFFSRSGQSYIGIRLSYLVNLGK